MKRAIKGCWMIDFSAHPLGIARWIYGTHRSMNRAPTESHTALWEHNLLRDGFESLSHAESSSYKNSSPCRPVGARLVARWFEAHKTAIESLHERKPVFPA